MIGNVNYQNTLSYIKNTYLITAPRVLIKYTNNTHTYRTDKCISITYLNQYELIVLTVYRLV